MENNLTDEKTLKVIELANELSNSSNEIIVYISNCPLAKGHLSNSIKFLDISDVEKITSVILKTIIEQVISEIDSLKIILIDNLSNMLSSEDIDDFLKSVNKISSDNNVKILFGLDRENKSFIEDLDIKKID